MASSRSFQPGSAATATAAPGSGLPSTRVALFACFVLAAAAVCEARPGASRNDAGGAAGSGAGGAAGGLGHAGEFGQDAGMDAPAARGGTDVRLTVHDAGSAAACVYDSRRGAGGSDAIPCHTLTVVFSPPLDPTKTLEVSTDLHPSIPVEPSCEWWRTPCATVASRDAGAVTSVVVRLNIGNAGSSVRYPSMMKVLVSRSGVMLEERTFSSLSYQCVARTWDDWCWEAEPVRFEP